MTSSQQLFEQCLKNKVPIGFAFFKFAPLKTIFRLLVSGAAFLAGAWVLAFYAIRLPFGETFWITSSFLSLWCLVSLIIALRDLRAFLHFSTSGILLTDRTIIKSFKGRFLEVPYEHVSNLSLVYKTGGGNWPHYDLSFIDSRTGKYIHLAQGHDFGPAENVYEAFLSQLRR